MCNIGTEGLQLAFRENKRGSISLFRYIFSTQQPQQRTQKTEEKNVCLSASLESCCFMATCVPAAGSFLFSVFFFSFFFFESRKLFSDKLGREKSREIVFIYFFFRPSPAVRPTLCSLSFKRARGQVLSQ